MADFSAAPLNYQQDIATPFQSAIQGYQAGAAIRNDQQAQQQQQQQAAAQQQSQQMLSALASNPNATGDDYARVMTAMPQLAEPLTKAWATKNDAQQQTHISNLLQYGAAIKNGSPQVAADSMTAQADAMEKAAGGPTRDSQALRTQAQVVVAHPQFAYGMIAVQLANGGERGKQAADTLATLGAEQRAQDQAPADLLEKQAKARSAKVAADVAEATVPAQIAKPTIENSNLSSQIANRAGQLALDQDKLASDVGLKIAELRRKPGAIDLPSSAETIINNAAGNAQVARQSASQLTDLADQFEKADPSSFGAGIYEGLKQLTGSQDYVTALRKEYVRLRSTQVNTLLPPGPASDVDIRNAMAGFPKETADSKELVSFMRGMAKLQNYNAQVEDARSEWANQVGSLGKPSRDIEVGGVTVPAGATFSDFMKKALKPIGAQTQPAAVGIKERLLKNYGNSVQPGD